MATLAASVAVPAPDLAKGAQQVLEERPAAELLDHEQVLGERPVLVRGAGRGAPR